MRKVNTRDIAEVSWSSPKGKFGGAGKEVSDALGRKPQSTDIRERHPFDVRSPERRLIRSDALDYYDGEE